VKPAVSAAARDTFRTAETAEAARHVAAVTASGRTAMVQPYLVEVEGEGETSVIVLGGTVTHAVRKEPMLARFGVTPGDVTAREPAADQIAFAQQVLDAVPERDAVLYARVDMLRLADGSLCLMELELTEPYLFLEYGAGAADHLALAVANALG
jgi:glutathione synthase/RimK-type ligase-like ATP-grasp enzyme